MRGLLSAIFSTMSRPVAVFLLLLTTAIWGLAAPEGLVRLDGLTGLSLRVVTAAIDERLNDVAFIVPGLGDAGDRQFGAV